MNNLLGTAIFWICCIGFNALIVSIGLSYLEGMITAIFGSMLPF